MNDSERTRDELVAWTKRATRETLEAEIVECGLLIEEQAEQILELMADKRDLELQLAELKAGETPRNPQVVH